MPNCIERRIQFGRLGRRVVEAGFDGGELSSDGGLMLLRRVDQRIGVSRAAAAAIGDARDPRRIEHRLHDLLAQRLYAMCCGYEDLNDHDVLRDDALMQTAVGRVAPLASSPTFSRLENRATRAQTWALHEVLVEQFIAAHQTPPEEIVLDVDASDVPLHGAQEQRQFHAYYDHHCYLPLYVFCGQAMLACYLRPSRIDGAKHAAAILKLLVKRLRRCWPNTRIIVRADSGFCRQNLIRWCERSGVGYVIGLARNSRLEGSVSMVEMAMREAFERTGVKQRELGECRYAAPSWDRERRVITRLEYGIQGVNPRFARNQSRGAVGGALRPVVLRTWRSREPHQGGADRFVRYARELSPLRGQPVPAIAGGTGLHLDAALARDCTGRHGTGARRGQHDARASAQNRRGNPAQHAPHPADAGLASSDARGVHRRCPPARRLESIARSECCPRHVEKQRG